ncbi:substrate-binding domain-containing protein [Diplocloster modestus]|uniref:Substrate-binding domain-containing protein n=1 Tax=Diplocloster modestus TaxID=2850322 RepID=A0ABS6KF28_9FIRM|nr:substrate-binding domain-containing protein [Diplocloster modestus]MBU9729089.1 substrate-binding domain-containing protein [Diplocloster modestus]
MKKWKKLLALGMTTAMVFSMAACTSNGETAEQTPAADSQTDTKNTPDAAKDAAGTDDAASGLKPEEITVAGIVYLEDQFMKLLSTGYQNAAKDYGVKCLTSNVNNDQAKEANQINTYLSQGVNGIAIAPLNEESSITSLKAAAQEGMKITLTDSTLADADFIVGGYTSDQSQLGESTGAVAKKFIEEKLDGKAKVAIVQFKSLLPEKSAARVDGFLSQIKDMPGVEVVADQDAWMQDTAVTTANDILTANPDIDIIFAANDGGTVGCTMAVKNAGLSGEVFVFGIDASEQIAAMLQDSDNILQAVTGQDAYGMGYNSMELLIKTLEGEETNIEEGSILTVDGILLDRADPDGINTFLANLKERTGE